MVHIVRGLYTIMICMVLFNVHSRVGRKLYTVLGLGLGLGHYTVSQTSSRNNQPLVHDVQAAGLTECGAQVEGPVVACACLGEVVLGVHLSRALQKEMADGFRDATPVAVSGSVSAPEMKMVVEAAVPESESVDGDFFPPVGVTEFPSQADGRLQGSVVGSGVGGGPLRLPLPEEEVAVDGSGFAVLQFIHQVHELAWSAVRPLVLEALNRPEGI